MKSQLAPSGNSAHRAGYVAIVGRPNVGKSTLLNRAVGQKISIVSRKPQTTRLPVTGIVTREDAQVIFVDTPGYQTEYRSPLNRLMNRTVTSAMREVQAVIWVVEALKFDHRDATVEEQLPPALPVVVAVNKIDRVAQKNLLLPFLARFSGQEKFSAIVPVSAEKGIQVEELMDTVVALLPEGPMLFEEDEITTVSERVLAAELLREKLFRFLGGEVPYATAVVIDQFQADPSLRRLEATILVERETQKGIIIGKHGEKLKTIATEARKDMEALFGTKVFLTVWVKVRKGWTSDLATIDQLGYGG